MKRSAIALISLLAVAMSLGYWWYRSGATRTAQKWVTCRGYENKALVSKADAEFWDEVFESKATDSMRTFLESCLESTTIASVEVKGRTAVALVKRSSPELTYQEMTEFPATAAPSQKLELLRQRAATKKLREGQENLSLVFEGLSWKVRLFLDTWVPLRRHLKEAKAYAKKEQYSQALEIYDRLLGDPEVREDSRKEIVEARLDALAAKACATAARRYLKHPTEAVFSLMRLSSSADDGKVSVHGEATAPNSFGVKGTFNVSCEVAFSSVKSAATVKLFLLQSDPISVTSEENIEVDL